MSTLYVQAWSLWTAEQGPPRAELLPPAQRRRCSLLSRMVAEVVGATVDAAALARHAIVCGTGYGEIATTVELLAMMREGDGLLSPIRFAGSVHNAPAGQLAIAAGHRGRSTTVSAGAHTVVAVWLEAMGLLAAGSDAVLAVLADEPMPAPLQPRHDGFALALSLSRQATAGSVGVRWLGSRRDAPAAARVPAALQANPLQSAWSLAQALAPGAAPQPCLRLEPDDERGHAHCVAVERHA
ncbi:MAG: beta-ketoacyl synthase chain length factor [Nannocystaceae bacterium]|nr:beta-ketoacyl synthase chain length factor [Nannocystaceae bacterium]